MYPSHFHVRLSLSPLFFFPSLFSSPLSSLLYWTSRQLPGVERRSQPGVGRWSWIGFVWRLFMWFFVWKLWSWVYVWCYLLCGFGFVWVWYGYRSWSCGGDCVGWWLLWWWLCRWWLWEKIIILLILKREKII